MKRVALVMLLAGAVLGLGCQRAYYAAMEKAGYEKRDILAHRVEDARDAQEAAKEQFRSALDRFMEVTGYQGGDLEAMYRKLQSEYERSEARAEAVRERVAAVDEVAGDLFAEWKRELDEYKSESMRRSSSKRLDETRRRYAQLIQSMRRAEKRMAPVLAALRDQVLFLKHNLNARAVASLRSELAGVEEDVSALVRDMEASIAEADAFLKAMGEAQG